MFTVALLMGLVVGFILGQITAHAFSREPAEPRTQPSQSVELQPIQTIIPSPAVSLEPEPVYLGEFRVTAYCSCEKCCGEWAKNRRMGG